LLQAYLASLSNQPTIELQWDQFDEENDLPIGDQQTGQAKIAEPANVEDFNNKFLKKKLKVLATKTSDNSKAPTAKQASSPTRPNTAPQARPSQGLDKGGLSAKKYSSGGQKTKKSSVLMSDSDGDLSMSLDEDVMNDVRLRKSNVKRQRKVMYKICKSANFLKIPIIFHTTSNNVQEFTLNIISPNFEILRVFKLLTSVFS